jgi:8-oxo-dGTP pyrophosphatase MutT (NUDIX family)
VTRSARSYRREAEQLRRQGMTYTEIAVSWQQRHGLNPRVAFRLAHGLTQAQVAERWNELWPDPDKPKTAKHISYWEIWPEPAGRAPSLDTLNKLAFIYRCRASDLLGGEDHSYLDPASATSPAASQPQAAPSKVALLTVALTVVLNRHQVLLVHRRDTSEGISWSFPTGIVKPGGAPAEIAVRETLAETGVHCRVEHSLGTRLHPVTGTYCEYFLCTYLAGVVENRDVVENVSATWVASDRVTDFIPEHLIFPPILEALEDTVVQPDSDTRPPIVAAIITADDRVLMAKRRVREGTLSWTFPAGQQEPGESSEATAIRETREEVGLNVTAKHVIGERIHPETGRHMIYVACHIAEGEAHVVDTEELSEITWCRFTDLDTYVPQGLFRPVRDYLENALGGQS